MPRFHFARSSFAREKATLLRKAVAAEGVDATLTACRDAYARLCGYRDFRELTMVAESGAHAPSSLVDDMQPGDAETIASAFGVSEEVASRVLAQVRPRAMGRPSAPASLPYHDWSSGERVPDFERLDIEKELVRGLRPHNGVFLFGGPSGQGIERMMASVVRRLSMRRDVQEWIVALPGALPPEMANPETRIHLVSGESAEVESSSETLSRILRLNPSIVVHGPVRSRQEYDRVAWASLSGRVVYAGSSGRTVGSVVGRMTDTCMSGAADDPFVARKVSASLSGICCQILVEGAQGGRTALREFVCLSSHDRETLGRTTMDRWQATIEGVMQGGAGASQSMAQAAAEAHRRGRISAAVRDRVVAEGR